MRKWLLKMVIFSPTRDPYSWKEPREGGMKGRASTVCNLLTSHSDPTNAVATESNAVYCLSN